MAADPQELPIPFWPMQESGLEELAGASPIAVNCIIDGKGAVRRRPCVTTYSGVVSSVIDSNGIDGIYITKDGAIYATGAPNPHHALYRVNASAAHRLTGANSQLAGSNRPTFAETEALIVMAAGSYIEKIDLATDLPDLLGGSPPRATHVIANNSRLLCNDVDSPFKNTFAYSAQAAGSSIAGHEEWDSQFFDAGFISAEARPDPVVALYENTNEIFPFGQTTLQVFATDPQTVYAPLATREYGTPAPYSVVKRDQTFYWLDHVRRFVSSDGRSVDQGYGASMQRTMNEISRVDDAYGFWVHTGPCDAIVWTFPTDGRTFAYQVGGGWSEWLGRDASGNNWSPFVVKSHFKSPIDSANVVGTSDGRIGMLSLDAQDDLGTRCVQYIETGAMDRGTDLNKLCISVKIALRQGSASDSSASVGRLSWKDDDGPWSDPLEIVPDSRHVVEFRSLGVYRRRRWRIEFSDAEELVIAKASELFQVLEA